MLTENINLLCIGDLHLGRSPSKIPEEYDNRLYSPALIWGKIVEKAIELKVDALIISGDLLDRDNCYYEAFGPFEEGVKLLESEKIFVFAVAGNHDYDVLPRLSKNIDAENFFLLGTGGKWEARTLKKNGKEILNLLGWSYPTQHVQKNPLLDIKLPENNLPTVGILHTDLDNLSSKYAPVRVNDLLEYDFRAWVLGHIHKPALIREEGCCILNPGSPQPLHPNEVGIHYAWQLKIKSNGSNEIIKHPVANIIYLNIQVDISDLESVFDIQGKIFANLENELEEETGWEPKNIIARIELVGRTELSRDIDEEIEKIKELRKEVGGALVLFEKLINKTKGVIDLESLAKGNSQIGLIADFLLKLESGREDELPPTLLKKLEDKLLEAYRSTTYQPLRSSWGRELEREDIYSLLKKQGYKLLEAMMIQKEGI